MTKDLQLELEKLRTEYIAKLHQTQQELDLLYFNLLKGKNPPATFQMLKYIVHKLAGSGRTFGWPHLSDAAKKLEQKIIETVDVATYTPGSKHAELIDYLQQLCTICRQIIESFEGVEGPHKVSLENEKKASLPSFIAIKSDHNPHVQQLVVQLTYIGFKVELMTTFQGLTDLGKNKLPDLIIIETGFNEQELYEIQGFLGQRDEKTGDIPILYLCAQNNFLARLTAVRLEGSGFLGLPTNSIHVVDQFYRLTQRRYPTDYHVLIIDEDYILAKRYALALENVGIQVTVLSDPHQALNLLSEKKIDLVLLDFNFPDCNGWEVARILRQLDHYRYSSLPIIFLSTEVSLQHFMRSANLGIEDFLTKPVVDEELVSLVLRRSERSSVLRNLIEQDSATGLLNHSRLKLDLNLEVLRSERANNYFSYALIDIDHFKVVNDNYGHFTGDIVIKTLAHLLQQRLRSIDSIGRYGGEEFGIIFPHTTADEALKVLSQINKKFSEIEFVAGNSKFFVTFSAGIADYPTFLTCENMNSAADVALYESKRQGRNRLTIATPEMMNQYISSSQQLKHT